MASICFRLNMQNRMTELSFQMTEMAWHFFIVVLLPLILYFLVKKQKKGNGHPPGPPGLPLIGNLHQFDSAKPYEFLMKLSSKYGPVMSLRLGSVPVLVLSSRKMAEEALKKNDAAFSGRPATVSSQMLSYNGLDIGFSPYGEYWREVRKITVLHLLSLKKVQSFLPVIEKEISQLVSQISDISSLSQLMNLSSTGLSLTSNITCRIAFGDKFDEVRRERKSFHLMMKEIETVLGGFFISDFFPSLSWVDNLSGMNRRLENVFKDLDSFYQELIEDHLNPNRPESMKNNFLDMLIQLKEEQSPSVGFSWDNIKAIISNIFIASTSTTAASIIWAMTALGKNPSVMKKVQAEIRDYFEKKGAIVEEELHKLPYLDAVIKETLRLYTPAPLLLPRETIKRCRIEGYEIEPRTLIFINAWAIARDPEIWENPNDFKPERFLNNSVDVKGQDFELIPFGAGRRGCPGISLALSTSRLALANLLYWFDWELPSGMKEEDVDTDGMPGITMLPKTALCLLAKKYA